MRKNYYLIQEESNDSNLHQQVVRGRKEAIKECKLHWEHLTKKEQKGVELNVIKLNVNKDAKDISEEIERAIEETFDYGYTPIYTIGEFNG